MDPVAVLVVGVLVVGAAVAAGGAVWFALRRSAVAGDHAADLAARLQVQLEAQLAEVQARAADEREAAIAAALDRVLAVNQAALAQQRQTAESDRRAAADQLDAKRELIDAQLAAMAGELGKVVDLVQRLDADRREKQGSLDATLAALSRSTQGLSQALASPKARGQWGERAADDILRAAGLVEGVSYVKQKRVEGGRNIPDFTFFLPDRRVLHMDVKFPVAAYLRFLEAGDDRERERHATTFLRDVRLRVKELTGRDYIDPERNTLDYVLCFIPNESVYGFILERDATVLEEALRQRVVFCSPSTVFAVLAVIRQAADTLRVEHTSNEILALLGSFEKQWGKFCDQLDKVGRHLHTTQNAYDELAGTRRRQLEKPLDQIDALRRHRGIEAAGDGAAGDGGAATDPPAAPLRAVGDDTGW